MEEQEISTCSFLSDIEIGESSQQCAMDLQKLRLENDHLLDINKQLEDNINSIKVQLKEAMDAASTVNGMNEIIASLKANLAETSEKEKIFSKKLQEVENQNQEEMAKLNEKINKLTIERDSAINKNNSDAVQIEKLRDEKQQLKADIKENNILLNKLFIQNQNMKKKNVEKVTSLTQNINSQIQKYQKLESDFKSLEIAKNNIEQELISLREYKQDSEEKRLNEVTNSNWLLEKEIQMKNQTIELIENQLGEQQLEIEEIESSRQSVVELMQKMHNAMSLTEIRIEALKKENELLKTRPKSPVKLIQKGLDLTHMSIPFEGELKEKASEIMKLPQYNQQQRIQLVLNEAARKISYLQQQITEASKNQGEVKVNFPRIVKENTEEKNSMENDQKEKSKRIEIIVSLIKQLKCSDLIDETSKADLVEFLAKNAAEFDPNVENNENLLKSDFFTLSIQQKIERAKKIFEFNDDCLAILSSQFILNKIQQKELTRLKEELSNSINTKDDIDHIKESNKKLVMMLKKAQTSEVALRKAESEARTKLSQSLISNDALQTELDVLRVKFQVASNELLLQASTNSIENDKCKHDEYAFDPEKEKLRSELATKSEEVEEIKENLRKLQNAAAEKEAKEIRKLKKQIDSLNKDLTKTKETLESTYKELQKTKRNSKHLIERIRDQYETKILDAQKQYEEGRTTLMDTIDKLSSKAREARESLKIKSKEASDAEYKVSELKSSLEGAEGSLKRLKAELASVRASAQRERQQSAGKLSAAQIAADSRLQSAVAEAKAVGDRRVRAVHEQIAKALGPFYGGAEVLKDEFSEAALAAVLQSACDDLERLSFFQAESTKFNSST